MKIHQAKTKLPIVVQIGLFVLVVMCTIYLGYQDNIDSTLLFISVLFTAYLIISLLQEYKTNDLVSPVAITSALFLLHFAIPGILLSIGFLNFVYEPNSQYAFYSQIVIIFSFLAFKFGAKLITLKINQPKFTKYVPIWGEGKVLFVIIILLVIGYTARLFFITKGLYFQETRSSSGEIGALFATYRQAERLPLLSLFIATIFYYSNIIQNNRHNFKYILSIKKWFYLIIILEAFEIAYWFPSGRKTDLLFAIVIPFIIRYMYIKKLPSAKVIIIFLVFVITFFQISNLYRLYMATGNYTNLSFYTAISKTLNDLEQKKYSRFHSSKNTDYMLKRLNLLESVSATIRLIETNALPVTYGEQYIWLGMIFIPRIIWDDKPNFAYGNEFGHKTGLLSSYNESTSISVTFIGEAYLNFSWLAPIVMLLFGLFFTYFYNKAKRRKSVEWSFLYILAVPILLYPGGTFALYFGGLVKSWIVAALLLIFMKSKRLIITESS